MLSVGSTILSSKQRDAMRTYSHRILYLFNCIAYHVPRKGHLHVNHLLFFSCNLYETSYRNEFPRGCGKVRYTDCCYFAAETCCAYDV
jgi:hypothetical protein